MTGLDWVIVGFTLLLAFYGYLQGFVVGALSLVGFALGAFLGTRIAPLLLDQGARSPYAPLFGLVGALLAGGVFASGLEGVGSRVRSALRIPGLQAVDGLLGAALTACVGLGIAWIVGAVALDSTGSTPLRSDLRGSTILRALDQLLPPSGPILNALARLDPHPVGARAGRRRRRPLAAGPARPAAWPRPARSVVRVYGTACGLGVEGSGWVAAPGRGGHQRPRRRRRERHRGPGRRRSAPARRRAWCTSIRTTTSRSCACPGWRCPRCR